MSTSQYTYSGLGTYFQTYASVLPNDHVYFGFWGGETSYGYIPPQPYFEYSSYDYSYNFSLDFSFSFDSKGSRVSSKGNRISSKHQNNEFFFGIYFYSSYDTYWSDYSTYYVSAPRYSISGGTLEAFVQLPGGGFFSQGVLPIYAGNNMPLTVRQPGMLSFQMRTPYPDWYYSVYVFIEHCEDMSRNTVQCPLR